MTEQELREKIDEFIWTILSFGGECSDEWVANQKSSGRPFIDHRRKYLFDLIRQANCVRLADDQMLPEVIGSSGEQRRAKRSYADDMLKAGFRKVEL